MASRSSSSSSRTAKTPTHSYAATARGNSNGIVPQSKINTLANILATCVNTSGPSSGPCTALFANATSDGTATGAKATDEANAIALLEVLGDQVHQIAEDGLGLLLRHLMTLGERGSEMLQADRVDLRLGGGRCW